MKALLAMHAIVLGIVLVASAPAHATPCPIQYTPELSRLHTKIDFARAAKLQAKAAQASLMCSIRSKTQSERYAHLADGAWSYLNAAMAAHEAADVHAAENYLWLSRSLYDALTRDERELPQAVRDELASMQPLLHDALANRWPSL